MDWPQGLSWLECGGQANPKLKEPTFSKSSFDKQICFIFHRTPSQDRVGVSVIPFSVWAEYQ